MSRTTVDDCMEKCDNRFNLSYRVALRAREIQRRGDPRVDMRDDKTIVAALREVSEGVSAVPPLAAAREEYEDGGSVVVG